MSVTQGRFGPSALNWRLTRSVTVFQDGTRLARRRSGSPDSPARCMSSATVVADQQPVGALQLGAGPGLDVGAVGGVTGLAARREGCPCLGVPPVSTRYPGGQGSNEMSGKCGDGPSSRWLSWWRRYLSKNAPMYVRSSVMAVFGLMVPRSDVT